MSVLVLWITVVILSAASTWVLTVAFMDRTLWAPFLIVLLGICAVAATAGIAGGLSREGVVGSIIAAALGLLGGVVVWLFAADPVKGVKIAVCAFAFSLALVTSYFEAASRRQAPESYAFWRARCADNYTNKELLNDPVAMSVLDASIGALCGQIFTHEKMILLDRRR